MTQEAATNKESQLKDFVKRWCFDFCFDDEAESRVLRPTAETGNEDVCRLEKSPHIAVFVVCDQKPLQVTVGLLHFHDPIKSALERTFGLS